jgi:hypothetical protein
MTDCIVYWLHDDTCKTPNEHGYVGVTTWPEKPKREHIKSKRFPEGFMFTVLLTGTIEQCRDLEEELRPLPYIGWNHGIGGWSPRRGASHTPEAKKKLSDHNKGKRLSPETIAKIVAKTKGQKRSDNFKESQRLRVLGKPSRIKGTKFTDEARANQSKAQKGRIITPKHAAKIAATLTGHVRTEASRVKQSASTKGKPKSPEHNKKNSKNAKHRFATPNGHASQIAKSRRGVQSCRVKAYGDSSWILT